MEVLTKLLASKKATMVLLTLLISVVALFTSKISGDQYTQIVAYIVGAYTIGQGLADTKGANK